MTSANPYASAVSRSAPPPTAKTDARGPAGAADRQRVITGEAVALDLAPASALSRTMSGVIDLIVYASTGLAVFFLAGRLATNDAQLAVVSVVAIATTMVIAPTTVETATRGLSAGKVAVGLRVVRDDGAPIRFRHAFIRSLVGTGEIWLTLGALALITSIVHPKGKRLGDMVAGTYSLNARETEAAPAPLIMPAELRPWAESADIRRLPEAMALYARIYLSRTASLSPQIRERIARSFAAALEPYVSPPPPWGTDPERFIAAVLVARRDREYLAGLAGASREHAEAQRARRLPYGIIDAS